MTAAAGAELRRLAAAPLPWHAGYVRERLAKGLPAALLVQGRLSDGLEPLCLHLAQAELSRGGEGDEALLREGTHPDLHYVSQEESAAKKLRYDIVIAQVRRLAQDANLTPARAAGRVCVIAPACHLNRSAADALLKILEEPHRQLRFILGCERIAQLPATIRSRCVLNVPPRPTAEQAAAWLRAEGIENAEPALEAGGNAPLLAWEHYKSQAVAGKAKDFAAAAASYHELLAKAHRRLMDVCTGKKDANAPELTTKQGVAPAVWLAWAQDWAAAGARLSMGLPAASAAGERVIGRGRARPGAWMELQRELQRLRQLARHEINRQLLLEKVAAAFRLLGDAG
ncbi:MAG: hypothetical protein ISN26_03785 [Betaproteobacteria bacterium AqS2]|uniref:DNA-directed DNA polymerase n=1 Tax=Candidatus Amphirhobacter heronislandensis TaxID=1732024 RepID=A0A930UC36_9GAMM|nr:hypothetical protein [Betaproteobacteria bacterium AqS2]